MTRSRRCTKMSTVMELEEREGVEYKVQWGKEIIGEDIGMSVRGVKKRRKDRKGYSVS